MLIRERFFYFRAAQPFPVLRCGRRRRRPTTGNSPVCFSKETRRKLYPVSSVDSDVGRIEFNAPAGTIHRFYISTAQCDGGFFCRCARNIIFLQIFIFLYSPSTDRFPFCIIIPDPRKNRKKKKKCRNLAKYPYIFGKYKSG